MKNRKGFTLVELLAVIVILAIILVIAIPQITKTIEAARLSAFRSSAKLILTAAEKDFIVEKTLDQYHTGKTYTGFGSDGCGKFTKLDENEYASCSVTVTDAGSASLNLVGKENSKFHKHVCTGATLADVDGQSAKCVLNNSYTYPANNG